MRLANLRPCDICGGPLFADGKRWFHVVRTSGALVTGEGAEAAREAHRLGIPLSDFAGDRPEGVEVVGDTDPRLLVELIICATCYHGRPIGAAAFRRLVDSEVSVGGRRSC